METIDLTPSWSDIAPALCEILTNSNVRESKEFAIGEIKKMARLADIAVERIKQERAEEEYG